MNNEIALNHFDRFNQSVFEEEVSPGTEQYLTTIRFLIQSEERPQDKYSHVRDHVEKVVEGIKRNGHEVPNKLKEDLQLLRDYTI